MTDFAARVMKHCAAELEGEALEAATLVHPPGSTLYKSYAGGKAFSGPIGEAISSKLGGSGSEGEAGRIPGSWGILALTDRRVLWFKAKAGLSIGPKPAGLIASWPRSEVTAEFESGSKWGKYPCFLLEFKDGTTVPLFTDRPNHPERLAEAWGIAANGA